MGALCENHQNLMALPGQVRNITSTFHPMALLQCMEFLKKIHLFKLKIRILQKQQENSRKQHKRNRAIAVIQQQQMYGLTILVQVQTITLNMTRFVILVSKIPLRKRNNKQIIKI
jgi:prephenate dehydratase